MKIVRQIFFDDVKGLIKNFFALVIVVGICFLPALYAWFNIYSNWDPYGNTGALKFAAVSLDKGYTDEDGQYHNQGDSIIENLHDNTSVDWQFVDTADEAVDGVYSGEYYAAVVIDEDFSYDMYNVLSGEIERPLLHFYENQKKNPVATKISDTVVQSLQNNINVAFTEVVISSFVSEASDFATELEEEGGMDSILDKLRTLSADLTTYQNALTDIIENDTNLKTSLEVAKIDADNLSNQAKVGANAITDSANVSSSANTTLSGYSNDINSALNVISDKSSEIEKSIDVAQATDDARLIASSLKSALINASEMEKLILSLPDTIGEENISAAKKEATDRLESMQLVLAALSVFGTDTSEQRAIINKAITDLNSVDISSLSTSEQIAEIDKRIEILNGIDTDALASYGGDALKQAMSKTRSEMNSVSSTITNKIEPKITNGLSSLTDVLKNSSQLLSFVGETFGDLEMMFSSIENSIDAANTSLEKTNEALVYVNNRLLTTIGNVEKAADSEKLQVLINALSGDPETYGKFFSTPVEVKTEAVYPIENYGSAVAPFYTTLAFWVGALILTAIIKIKPDKSKYPAASERQLFFGRYALYWILGQIQSAIIVAGDIFILHVQCLHPWLFLLAGSITATTFTILIYSLVITWGDVGKAIAVVLVVIQIAGSSGTYPIELLPEFFRKVYIFFPFPYAINAIRECLCGTYEYDYLIYLGCLFIFMGVSLVIGLLVRIPFESINHYMEDRMEDTGLL